MKRGQHKQGHPWRQHDVIPDSRRKGKRKPQLSEEDIDRYIGKLMKEVFGNDIGSVDQAK